ncbi:hypothetical protein EI42_03149 [Thermosporothrix hazakensis]|jgi:hypothetical protein|uniref:Uncharacterized protein n=1 Tax=Thermosporothrix hazakensis TaxID=644383 RepID=A0A326UED8_THEHA|nr:DUF6610 family protein [Thermosporothrix hazakensis]PZW28395.1 hypothetical protein EI42_03149 [Thermosporothrix hazakensis]GCE45175.1 hypothetical protein KTH_00440 [Thermosporothrix hazakensis]
MIDLIYCAGGNKRLQEVALDEGWLLGLRSDSSLSPFPQQFVDVDYKNPDFLRHISVVQHYRPKYATVPDLPESGTQATDIMRVLRQRDLLAPYCGTVFVVPKLHIQVLALPADVAIGYSVPSSYGGARYPVSALAGRKIHLLGGSPRKQMEAYKALAPIATVTSVDGNYGQKMAVRFARYWADGRWHDHPAKAKGSRDIYYECWQRTCRALREAWTQLTTEVTTKKER